jgi:hypothetical protein
MGQSTKKPTTINFKKGDYVVLVRWHEEREEHCKDNLAIGEMLQILSKPKKSSNSKGSWWCDYRVVKVGQKDTFGMYKEEIEPLNSNLIKILYE